MQLKYYLLLICLGLCVSITAQQKPTRILKLDPLAFFTSTISVKAEQVLFNNFSLQIGGSFSTQQMTMWEGLEGSVNGYGMNFQVRKYFLPGYANARAVAPEGVYLGIWGRYEHLNAQLKIGNDKADMLNGAAYSGGGLAGCQFWLRYKKKELVLMDVFMGAGYKISDYAGRFSEQGRLIAFARSGIVPRFVMSFGVPIGK